MKNRLKDIVNQMIVVGNIENGYSYYKSKNGTMVKVADAGKPGQMTVSGGWQLEHGLSVRVDSIYDMSTTGNGKSYSISSQVPMPASKSVYQTLLEHEEYSEFLKLLVGSQYLDKDDIILASSVKLGDNKYSCLNPNSNSNISLFGTYNYTVYVPTNESILKLVNDGVLPTWDDYDEQFLLSENAPSQEERDAAKAACTMIKNRILDFVKYHIQDNGVAVNGAPETGENGVAIFKTTTRRWCLTRRRTVTTRLRLTFQTKG